MMVVVSTPVVPPCSHSPNEEKPAQPTNQEAIATLLAPSGCGVTPLVVGCLSVSHHHPGLVFILLGEDDFCLFRLSDGGLS